MMWIILASAWACTLDTTGKVVGYDGSHSKALIRVERVDERYEGKEIDLYVLDLETGEEIARYEILNFTDNNDASLRGARWKAAEEKIKTAGIHIDGEIPFVKAPWRTWTFDVPETDLVLATSTRELDGDENMLVYRLRRDETEVSAVDVFPVARGATVSLSSFYQVPSQTMLLLNVSSACNDPTFKVLRWKE